MKKATIDDIAYLLSQAKSQGLPQPIIFLGAGASKSGGVPLAREIVIDILEKYKENPRVMSLDVQDRTYPKLMECLLPFERNKLLKDYIDSAKINVTHIYLAQLMIEGFVDYVLTVNFDNLMLRALALYNNFPATYDMAILKDLTTTSFKEKSVVYLHGQHHGLWLLNTAEEMEKVKEIIPPILDSIKNQRPWIFIGYSGEDPIFEYINKLGRFDNGLYWVSYLNNDPSECVTNELLERSNANAHLVSGYDADSFMLKLNSVLRLPQPLIFDKPFTSLMRSLNNIVDIEDLIHFKGVKERLDIVKNDVRIAIDQFERGQFTIRKKGKEELAKGLLKKKIIDIIIGPDFDEKEIKSLEEQSKAINDPEFHNLWSSLYSNWGVSILNLGKTKKDIRIVEKAMEKFEKAARLNPSNEFAINNFGLAISEIGISSENFELMEQANSCFKKASELDPTNEHFFNNWGINLGNMARLKANGSLFNDSFAKFMMAVEIKEDSAVSFVNWGNAISGLAKLENSEKRFNECCEKYKKALELDALNCEAYCNWGIALYEIAEISRKKEFWLQSFEKFRAAHEINPKNGDVLKGWASAIRGLAKIESNQKGYIESFAMFEKAIELDPDDYFSLNNLGVAYSELARLENDKSLFSKSLVFYKQASELNNKKFNVACGYANIGEKAMALKVLEECLLVNEVSADDIQKDIDWQEYKTDKDYIELIKKYSI